MQGAIIDYADKKRFALDLLADAARTNDNDKQVWGEQVMAHDYAMARHIAQMIQDPH